MSITIGIISPNSIFYSDLSRNHSLTISKVEDDIEDFIELKKIDKNDLVNQITVALGPDSSFAHTSVVYEDEKYLYEMCHLESDDKTKKNVNNIAIHLAKCEFRIIGNAVLLKSRINVEGPYDVVNDSITMNDIIGIYYKTLVHTGVKVLSDETCDEYKYMRNPIDLVQPNQMENMRYYEVVIYNRIFQIWFDLKTTDRTVNRTATILNGKSPIYGPVYIGVRYKLDDIRMTEPEFADITTETLTNLIDILEHTNEEQDRSITTEDETVTYKIVELPDIDGNMVKTRQKISHRFVNFYTVIQSRLCEFKNSTNFIYNDILTNQPLN